MSILDTSKFTVPTKDLNIMNVLLPHSITFCAKDGLWAMRIIENRIEVNEDMQVPDVAKAVLDALQVYLSANYIPSIKYEPYTTRISTIIPGDYEAYVDYNASKPYINMRRVS